MRAPLTTQANLAWQQAPQSMWDRLDNLRKNACQCGTLRGSAHTFLCRKHTCEMLLGVLLADSRDPAVGRRATFRTLGCEQLGPAETQGCA